jgi:hypothetical protein
LRMAQKRSVDLQNASQLAKDWLHSTVLEAMGGKAYAPGRKCYESTTFDIPKSLLTWATMDRAIWLLSQGNADLLIDIVADPQMWIQNRYTAPVVMFDHTPLWVKFQAEDKVILSTAEGAHARGTKKLKHLVKTSVDQDLRDQYRNSLLEHIQAGLDNQTQAAAMCQGGDKYRLTLITFQTVHNWFNPNGTPRGEIPKSVLIVPCSIHAKLSDITPEGTWAREALKSINQTCVLFEWKL